MLRYKASELVKAAKQIADCENSEFISHNESVRLLNESYTYLYNLLINKGDTTFVKSIEIKPGKTELPEDFYNVYSVNIRGIPVKRYNIGTLEGEPSYKIIGNCIESNVGATLQYNTVPTSLYFPNEVLESYQLAEDETIIAHTGKYILTYKESALIPDANPDAPDLYEATVIDLSTNAIITSTEVDPTQRYYLDYSGNVFEGVCVKTVEERCIPWVQDYRMTKVWFTNSDIYFWRFTADDKTYIQENVNNRDYFYDGKTLYAFDRVTKEAFIVEPVKEDAIPEDAIRLTNDYTFVHIDYTLDKAIVYNKANQLFVLDLKTDELTLVPDITYSANIYVYIDEDGTVKEGFAYYRLNKDGTFEKLMATINNETATITVNNTDYSFSSLRTFYTMVLFGNILCGIPIFSKQGFIFNSDGTRTSINTAEAIFVQNAKKFNPKSSVLHFSYPIEKGYNGTASFTFVKDVRGDSVYYYKVKPYIETKTPLDIDSLYFESNNHSWYIKDNTLYIDDNPLYDTLQYNEMYPLNIDYKTGYGFLSSLKNKPKQLKIYPITQDTILNIPSNVYYNIIAYQMAISIKNKLGQDATFLRETLNSNLETLYNSLGRDNTPLRITNIYKRTI